MIDIAPKQAVLGWSGEELHLQAAVVASREAGFAGIANEVGLDSYTISRLEMLDGGVDSEDFTGGLVAEDVVVLYDHWTYTARVPEVDIGSGLEDVGLVSNWQTGHADRAMGTDKTDPHIPVVRTPIVTSPSVSSFPSFTTSRLGCASPTQSLCSGLVKTPTLALVMVSVVDIVGDDGELKE